MKKRVTYKTKEIRLPDSNNLPKPCYAEYVPGPRPSPGPAPLVYKTLTILCALPDITITINGIERATATLLQGTSYSYTVARPGYHTIVGMGILQENAVFTINENQFVPLVISNSYESPEIHPFSEGSLSGLTIVNNALQLTTDFMQNTNFTWDRIGSFPTNQTVTTTPNSILVIGPRMMPEGRVATFRTQSTQAYGTWEAEISIAEEEEICQKHYLLASSDDISTMNGYVMWFEYSYDYTFLDLFKVTNGQESFLQEWYARTDRHMFRARYRISRDQNGTFRCWFKNVTSNRDWQLMTDGPNPSPFVDNTYTSSNYLYLQFRVFGGNNVYEYQMSSLPATGSGNLYPSATYISPVIYAGPNFKNWDKIVYQQNTTEGTGTMYIRFKNSTDTEWSSWGTITSGQTLSVPKDSAQLKWEATSNAAQTAGPTLNSFTITWEENNS